MDDKKITVKCEFENISAADVLDGLGTLTFRSGRGAVIPPPGKGPDDFLRWAIQEVSDAFLATAERQNQLCTNAVLNSRRALACLVDWYLERDLGTYCKDPPGTPKQKANFLMRRGIIDELTSRVLERATDKRNLVEHEYESLDLNTAEDVVELIRRTMAAIRNQEDPSLGPWIFGSYEGGCGFGDRGPYAEFRRWLEPLLVFSRLPPRPWIGLVLPDGEAQALVRRAYFDSTAVDELVELLALAERKFGHPSFFAGPEICKVMERELGLVAPE